MRLELRPFGQSLVSRTRGAEIRIHVRDQISKEDQDVELDSAEVLSASYSFIDELVGKLFTMVYQCR